MSTILTDGEIVFINALHYDLAFRNFEADIAIARAVEAAVLAKLAQQADRQRVPDGWKLVPVEPTDEMVDAACDKSDFFRVDFVLAWDAAINASPELTQSATSHTHKVVPVTPTKEMLISGARAPVELLSPDGALQVYRAMLAAAPEAPAQAEEISPEFTDTARAALLWVLWHHQGGSSDVGQPIRFALGMGQYEKMNAHQVREAKRWAALNPKPTHEAPAQASAVDERAAFEAWYSQNAFNFERDPIGSRECGLQWKAWQARAALAQKGGAA